VLTLQRSIGNAAVARLIANRVAPPAASPPIVQAKLTVGRSDDPFEQEANSVASRVVSHLHGAKQITSLPTLSNVQRSTTPALEQDASAQGGEVAPDMANRIQQARGGGRRLDAPVRSAMEQAFGANFGGVRIHQNRQSDTLNRSINARAFTTGQDVFFRQGEYRPGSTAGQGLLAHELTHVVQQSGGALQRSYQAEADTQSPQDRLPSAQRVAASGRTLGQPPLIAQRAPSGRIHRCGDDEKKSGGKKSSVSIKRISGSKPKKKKSGKSPKTTSSPPTILSIDDTTAPIMTPSVSTITGGSPKSTHKKSGKGKSGKGKSRKSKPTITAPLITLPTTMPVDSASDLRSTAPKSTAIKTSDPRLIGRDTTAAIEKISKSGLDKFYIDRAIELINDPDQASQASYGICGLTSMLRSILISDPDRFVTLTIQALSDTDILDDWQEFFQDNSDIDQEHKELDFLVAQWLVRNSTKGPVSQKVLKHNSTGGVDEITKTKDYDDVFEHQVDFSDTFNIPDWEPGGHFATTAGGLNYIYSSVTGKEGYKIKITDFAKDWALAKSKAGPTGSVNASIKGHDFYKDITTGTHYDKETPIDTPPALAHPAKYRHWVTFDDVTEENHKDTSGITKKFFRIKVWTYEDYWDALVSEDVIGQYIHSLVVM
jgi:hypothetical protein